MANIQRTSLSCTHEGKKGLNSAVGEQKGTEDDLGTESVKGSYGGRLPVMLVPVEVLWRAI